jgi:Protein of unknown function (DUF1631)
MSQAPPRKLGISDDPHGPRITLRQCLDAALQQSEGLMDKLLNSLAGKPEKAFGANQTKPNFPPAAQAVVDRLVAQRDTVKQSFNRHLRECVFQGLGADTQAPQMMRFEDLKLFEEEDLDESIEVARALHEMSAQVDDIMPQLDAMMSSLLGWITVQSSINPLRPEMFARALRECVAEQTTDVDIRAALLSSIANRLGVLLRKLYVELIAWLKSCGVEFAGIEQPGQVQTSVAKPSVVGSVGNSVTRTLLTLDRLRRLLSGELDADTRKPQDFLHTVPASVVALQDMRQVEAMVQRLETKARKSAQNPSADDARKKAAARLALADGKNLGKQLGEEVVRLMLDNLIQDERLLPVVRGHLQTLEPLLMDIAKVDGRFFSDKQHAARQFLDKVTNRSLAFGNERDEGYAQFVKSIEKSIASLHKKTAQADNASQAFGDVLQQLEKQWELLDAEDKARREEAARALMHAEQRNMLAQYLAQEFRTNAEGVDVPRAVVDFVCGPWSQAVAESQLRCTDGTSDPQGYHELVAELYWSVQPRVAKRNRKRLVQIIPGMLGKLRQGLHLIEFPPERITDFFAELIAMHEAALEGGRPKPVVPEAAPPDIVQAAEAAEDQAAMTDRAELEALYAASDDSASSTAAPLAAIVDATSADFSASKSPAPPDAKDGVWMGNSEALEAGFVQEAAVTPIEAPGPDVAGPKGTPVTGVIAIGSWVELQLDDQWMRAQLTWASPHRTLFMFVSHGGKAHSMSQRTMDKLRAQGMIRIISDGRLVDKALDAVAQTALRNSIDADSADAGTAPA